MKYTSLKKSSKKHLLASIALAVSAWAAPIAMAETPNQPAFERKYESDSLTIDFQDKDNELYIKTNVKARINNASLLQAKELIFDLSRVTSWLGGAKEATVIERFSADRQKGVLINAMPFPLDDREILILLEVASADEHHIALKMTSDYSGVTANDKYVRVDPYTADLVLTKDGDDVIFELNDYYNAKISLVPEFTVVRHLKSISYDTIENVSKLKF